jgi:nickel-dependent lactate racemase
MKSVHHGRRGPGGIDVFLDYAGIEPVKLHAEGTELVYRIPFSTGEIAFNLPRGMQGSLAVSQPIPRVGDVPVAIAKALDEPMNSPPLRELAGPGARACIVFTDITRASPDHLVVPALLAELEAAGVRDQDVTLLCGIGMHRPSTVEEKVTKLGRAIVERYRVIDNEPQNPQALADLGVTDSGVPLSVHKAAYEADLLIGTGLVEPHQYAGYSGARKTVAVGAAGEAMIAYTHGPQMLDHPGTRLGRIEGNPFHEAVTEAARRAGLNFILNVVLDDHKRVVTVKAGEPETTFMELVGAARQVYEVPVPQRYDVVIGGVGYPKDTNLYQATRAASYLFFAPTPVVKDGGFLIIAAPCEEGAGQGVGEQRYYDTMLCARDVSSLLEELRRTGYPPGAQRAFVMAKVLEKARVVVVGAKDPQVIRDCKMIPADTMDDALELASRELGAELDVLVVPHATLTLPIVAPSVNTDPES